MLFSRRRRLLVAGGGGQGIPSTGLLVYLTRPLSDNLLIPEEEEYDESTIDIGFVLSPRPGATIEQVMEAVGHESGTASYWFDADDEPITRLAVGFGSLAGDGISEQNFINQGDGKVYFKLKDAEEQTGTLAIYGQLLSLSDKLKLYKSLFPYTRGRLEVIWTGEQSSLNGTVAWSDGKTLVIGFTVPASHGAVFSGLSTTETGLVFTVGTNTATLTGTFTPGEDVVIAVELGETDGVRAFMRLRRVL